MYIHTHTHTHTNTYVYVYRAGEKAPYSSGDEKTSDLTKEFQMALEMLRPLLKLSINIGYIHRA